MLNVVSGTTKQPASASQATKATPMKDAGNMNVCLIQNVLTQKHVAMRSVLTPVTVLKMLNVF